MENIEKEIFNWYQDVGNSINCTTLYPNVIKLLRYLRANHDLQKEDVVTVGPLIAYTIKKDLAFDIGNTIYQTLAAYKVKQAFEVVFRDIKEIIEETEEPDGIDQNGVRKGNFTTEPSSECVEEKLEYDEVQQTQEDLDFLAGLKFEKEI